MSGLGSFCDVYLGREVGNISVVTRVWGGEFFTGKVRTAGRARHHWEAAAALREWKWGCFPFRGISNSWEEGGTRPVGGREWEAGDWQGGGGGGTSGEK